MSDLPYSDPSNPALPSPLFSDVAAVRGDHMRANNAAIFADLLALNGRNPELVALTSGSFKTAALANANTYNGRSLFTCTAGVSDTPFAGAWRIFGFWNPADSSGRFVAMADTSLETWEINYAGAVWGAWKQRVDSSGNLNERRITISNASGDATNDVTLSAGRVWDSSDLYLMELSTALTKRTDADFAAGNDAGGGNLSSSAWYHVYLIRKDSDGSIDAYFDTDGAAANIPAGYTAYRHVGWIYHSTSTGVTAFTQSGDRFYLKTRIESYNSASTGIDRVSVAVTAPPNTIALIAFATLNGTVSNSCAVIVTALDQTDETPTHAGKFDLSSKGGSGYYGCANLERKVDSSSQLGFRASYSSSSITQVIYSLGWIDSEVKAA